MTSHKPVHSIVLDAGPILKNDPSVSTLLAKSDQLYTVPAIILEIRDSNARSRVETTLFPFLTIRNPKPDSLKVVRDFARKTGDLPVLSTPDLQVLGLAYELELERNNGDWRLRKTPGQKKMNGSPPKVLKDLTEKPEAVALPESDRKPLSDTECLIPADEPSSTHEDAVSQQEDQTGVASEEIDEVSEPLKSLQVQSHDPEHDSMGEPLPHNSLNSSKEIAPEHKPTEFQSESSDSEGWITPSNLKRQQAKEDNASTEPISEEKVLQVGTLTGDFAMQNVLLQIGLNLLSPSIQRVKTIRTYILRCHACFEKVKDMNKQFCPRCGNSTLTRVSCSTNAKGEFKLHLKKNMQWNHRGDRYSIPKLVPGAANGKIGQSRGGGKGGWGQELILTEDQKEYQRAVTGRNRKKETDLMDEDYLPGILTGERGRAEGRPKVGAGRNVNSKKRI